MCGLDVRSARPLCGVLLTFVAITPVDARPIVQGSSTTTVGYTTGAGPQSFNVTLDYTGATMADALPLIGAPNIRSFNSINTFGRRTFLESGGTDVLDEATESLIAHAFFKITPGGDYFPGLVDNGNISVNVSGITFDQPVFVDHSTVMLHALWQDPQVQGLTQPYFGLHNHHTDTDPFRDFAAFFPNVFLNVPVPNYVLDSDLFQITFSGEGTNELSLSATFSYDALEHLEEIALNLNPNPEDVDGLPAPQGFLEPFHFHIEYVVVPEPSTLVLLGTAFGLAGWRRRIGAGRTPEAG